MCNEFKDDCLDCDSEVELLPQNTKIATPHGYKGYCVRDIHMPASALLQDNLALHVFIEEGSTGTKFGLNVGDILMLTKTSEDTLVIVRVTNAAGKCESVEDFCNNENQGYSGYVSNRFFGIELRGFSELIHYVTAQIFMSIKDILYGSGTDSPSIVSGFRDIFNAFEDALYEGEDISDFYSFGTAKVLYNNYKDYRVLSVEAYMRLYAFDENEERLTCFCSVGGKKLW